MKKEVGVWYCLGMVDFLDGLMSLSPWVYIHFGIISLFMLGLILIESWFCRKLIPRPHLNIKWILLSCSPFFLMVIYAVLSMQGLSHGHGPYTEFAPFGLVALLLLQLSVSIVTVHRSIHGAKLLTSFILIWAFLLSYAATFIAYMSVSGDWV